MAKKAVAQQGRATHPWTVLIYMIADDPAGGALLDQQANRELDQIIHATLSVDRDQMYVAVQLDFRSQPDVWRRVIGEGAWLQPESDAADPETLYGFFEWAGRMCPADRYLLILWGHSRGPFGLFTDAPFSSALAGLFAKPDPWTYVAQTLTLKELRWALRHARECLNQEVDIVAFKDCFMSSLETAYELKDAATYLIASHGHRAGRGLAVRADVRAARPAARRQAGRQGPRQGTAAALQGRGQSSRPHRCAVHTDGYQQAVRRQRAAARDCDEARR